MVWVVRVKEIEDYYSQIEGETKSMLLIIQMARKSKTSFRKFVWNLGMLTNQINRNSLYDEHEHRFCISEWSREREENFHYQKMLLNALNKKKEKNLGLTPTTLDEELYNKANGHWPKQILRERTKGFEPSHEPNKEKT